MPKKDCVLWNVVFINLIAVIYRNYRGGSDSNETGEGGRIPSIYLKKKKKKMKKVTL